MKSKPRLYVLCILDSSDKLWFMTEYSFSLGFSDTQACVFNRPDHCGYLHFRTRGSNESEWFRPGISIKKVFLSRLNSKTCPIDIDINDKTKKISKYNWKVTWKN